MKSFYCRCLLVHPDVIVEVEAPTRGKAQAAFHALVSDSYPFVYIPNQDTGMASRRPLKFTDHEARRAIPGHWTGLVEPPRMRAY